MTNGERAKQIIDKYGFDFKNIPKNEVIDLIQKEIANFQSESSEYIRLLCGYLYCIGDVSDVPLLEKAKYKISMDVGCMIDGEWIESLKNGGQGDYDHLYINMTTCPVKDKISGFTLRSHYGREYIS